MIEGTVKWFDKRKGYGFISYEDSPDIFVHYTGFADATMRTLDEGEHIFFEIVQGEKGPRAEKVSRKSATALPQGETEQP